MFYERRTHSVVKLGDFIYVCGGINSKGDPLNTCEKYSLEFQRWVKISSMKVGNIINNLNIARSHHSMCTYNNDYIFSLGGENRYESLLDTIERYSVIQDVWEILSVKMPLKMECVGCIQYNNEILVLGGYSCELGSLKNVYSLDLVNNSIRKLSKDLIQSGWSIYQPIRQDNTIHIFYGGEDEFHPQHITYTL